MSIQQGTGNLDPSYHEAYRSAKDYLKIFKQATHDRPNFPYSKLVSSYEEYMKLATKDASSKVIQAEQAEKLKEIENAVQAIGASKRISFIEGEGKHKKEITSLRQMLDKYERRPQEPFESWQKRLFERDAVEINLDGGGSGLYITGGFDVDFEAANELRGQQRDWLALFVITIRNLLLHRFASNDHKFNAVTQKFVDNWNADNKNIGKDFKLVFDPEKFGSMIVAQSKNNPEKIMKLDEALKANGLTTSDLIKALNADYIRAGRRDTITLKENTANNESNMTFKKEPEKQSVVFDQPNNSAASSTPPSNRNSVTLPAGITIGANTESKVTFDPPTNTP